MTTTQEAKHRLLQAMGLKEKLEELDKISLEILDLDTTVNEIRRAVASLEADLEIIENTHQAASVEGKNEAERKAKIKTLLNQHVEYREKQKNLSGFRGDLSQAEASLAEKHRRWRAIELALKVRSAQLYFLGGESNV